MGLIKMLTESIRSLLEGKVDRSISEEINSQISRTLGDFGSSGLGYIFIFLKLFNFNNFKSYIIFSYNNHGSTFIIIHFFQAKVLIKK